MGWDKPKPKDDFEDGWGSVKHAEGGRKTQAYDPYPEDEFRGKTEPPNRSSQNQPKSFFEVVGEKGNEDGDAFGSHDFNEKFEKKVKVSGDDPFSFDDGPKKKV